MSSNPARTYSFAQEIRQAEPSAGLLATLMEFGMLKRIRSHRPNLKALSSVWLVLSAPLPLTEMRFQIDGTSMEPTLQDRQVVNVKLFHQWKEKALLRNSELVVFKNPQTQRNLLVKRLVALPGDAIEVHSILWTSDYLLSVNGHWVHPHGGSPIFPEIYSDTQFEFLSQIFGYQKSKVPNGFYFVLSDHAEKTLDSRIFGWISEDLLVGKVMEKE